MLATDVDAGGGVARQSYALLGALTAGGARAFLLARNYSSQPRSEVIDGIRVRRTPVIGRFRPVNSLLYLADVLTWLVRNASRYDVVHAQQMSGPAVVAVLASRVTGRPVLVRVTSCGEQGEIREIARMPFAGIRRRLLQDVDRWVALTREMRRELEAFGIPHERIAVIPNGTRLPGATAYDPETRCQARERIGYDGQRLVVYSGRLSSEKGLDSLLRAWREVESAYADADLFLLGGGGAYRNVADELRMLCRELGLSRVRFLGHVSDVGSYLLAADAFVLPSRTEGMSNSLVEAMAAGCAIVASDIPANRELLTHGVEALLFPVDDVQALARSMVSVLDDPTRSHALARAARQKAEADLSIDAMARRYAEQYAALAGLGPHGR